MSWMDSWSRPSKSQATPPPLYLTQPDTKYCHTCGRTISPRKRYKTESTTPAKYCSSRCRSSKPGVLERRIECAFVALLDGRKKFEGEETSNGILEAVKKNGRVEGEGRGSIEGDETKIYGRKKNSASGAIGDAKEWKSVDMESDDKGGSRNSEGEFVQFTPVGFARKVRAPQEKTDINASVGGEKGWAERAEETTEAAEKRRDGQKVADEKEMVKKAARRGCVFGFDVQSDETKTGKAKNEKVEGEKRLCEAVMNGIVVEPSFAKGDWGIRWRE